MKRPSLVNFMIAAVVASWASVITPVNAQEPMRDIRAGITSRSLIYAPLFYAQRKGIFTDAGLNVEIVDAGGGTKLAAGLTGGSFPVTLNAIDHYFAASMHGQNWIILGQLMNREPYTYAMRKELAQQKGITSASPLDARLKALDGLTMGISALGSGTHIALATAMERVGLDPSKAKWVPIGDPLAIVSALQQGQVDVGGRAPGPAEMAVARGAGVMVLDFSRDQVGEPYPTIVVISTIPLRGKYARELGVLVKGLNEGIKQMRSVNRRWKGTPDRRPRRTPFGF